MSPEVTLKSSSLTLLPFALIASSVLGISGCTLNPANSATSGAAPLSKSIQGRVFGGQQPVVGASIQLYTVGAPSSGGGYGQGSTALLTGVLPVTDANGGFNITGLYTVPTTPNHFYIVASGGNPGVGGSANSNSVLMSALGACTATVGLPSSLFVNINEVTTMASNLALQPFMAAPALSNNSAPAIGAPSTAYNALQNAFETVNNLVNTSTGSAVLPTDDWAASTINAGKINTLGDILASCVNSDPLSSNSCSTLFGFATPSGTPYTATDTTQAAYYIAQNPTNKVSELFNLIPAQPPFVALSSPPADYTVSVPTSGVACQSPVNLLTAANFEALAASSVTNTGGTVITGGNLGLYPGLSVTGFPPGTLTTPAQMHVGDVTAMQAEADLTTAYNTTAALPGGALLPADISGLILTPGLYKTTTTGLISTSLTLDAQGDSSAVFIFQIGTALTVAGGAQLNLINGAQASNIFWQSGTATSLGAGSAFYGTILAGSSVTFGAGASLQGRALAQTGAVTFSNNAVTAP